MQNIRYNRGKANKVAWCDCMKVKWSEVVWQLRAVKARLICDEAVAFKSSSFAETLPYRNKFGLLPCKEIEQLRRWGGPLLDELFEVRGILFCKLYLSQRNDSSMRGGSAVLLSLFFFFQSSFISATPRIFAFARFQFVLWKLLATFNMPLPPNQESRKKNKVWWVLEDGNRSLTLTVRFQHLCSSFIPETESQAICHGALFFQNKPNVPVKLYMTGF